MNSRTASLISVGLIAMSTPAATQKQRSLLPNDSHFSQLNPPLYRRESVKESSWAASTKVDKVQYRIVAFSATTREKAIQAANDAAVRGNQRFRPDAKATFFTKSVITHRPVGEAYWIAAPDLEDIKGGTIVVVRNANDIFVGYINKIGRKATGYPDPKPVTTADIKLIEDLILDAIEQSKG